MVNFVELDNKKDLLFYAKYRIGELRKERKNALGDMERLHIDREIEEEEKFITQLEKEIDEKENNINE